jgi:hypothetical protein
VLLDLDEILAGIVRDLDDLVGPQFSLLRSRLRAPAANEKL